MLTDTESNNLDVYIELPISSRFTFQSSLRNTMIMSLRVQAPWHGFSTFMGYKK